MRAPRAYACSCDAPDPVNLVGTSSAAFVGVATEIFELTDESGEKHFAASFEVTKKIKGELGESVVLLVKSQEDTCGPPRFLPGLPDTYFGRPASIVVWGSYASEDCTGLSPDFLPQQLEGLPPPVQGVDAEVVWTQEWMGTSMRLIGRSGDFVAYAEPTGAVGYSAAMCGSSEVLAHTLMTEGVEMLVWRDMASMQVLAARPLPVVGQGSPYVRDCAENQRVLLALSDEPSSWRVFDRAGLDFELPAGSHRVAMSGDGLIAAAEDAGGHISGFEIESGATVWSIDRTLLGPGEKHQIGLNTKGDLLAVGTHDGKGHLTVIDADGQVITKADVPVNGTGLWWLDEGTIVVGGGDGLRLVSLEGVAVRLPIDRVDGDVVSHASARVLTRDRDSRQHTVTDLTNGQSFDIPIPDAAERVYLLPAPLRAHADGFVPSAGLPLPGARPPSTVDELAVVTNLAVRTRTGRLGIIVGAIGLAVAGCLLLVVGRKRRR